MTDQEKELIELAAKAMGYTIDRWDTGNNCEYALIEDECDCFHIFNPLTSRDDRGLLMEELEISLVWHMDTGKSWVTALHGPLHYAVYHNNTPTDRKRAACLAVTRVAAEIGRTR